MKKTITAAALLALSLPAFAVTKHGAEKEAKVIDEAAVALENNNPDLSKQLKDIANRESTEAQTKTHESVSQDRSDAKILKEGADALRQSRPDLAKKLDKYAKRENKEMKHDRGSMHENRMQPNGSQGGY